MSIFFIHHKLVSNYTNIIILHLNFIFKYPINYKKHNFKIIFGIDFDKNHYKDIIYILIN